MIVEDIQRDLNRLGANLVVDGRIGPLTRAAIQSAGLDPDGTVEGVARKLKRKVKRLPVPRVYLEQLQALTPAFPAEWLPSFLKSLPAAGISTPIRLSHYVAQLAHESAHFKTLTEYASGQAYEGRTDLGNTEPGDGKRYKGRGPIQLTGRANYRRAGQVLGVDLEGNPELAATPEIGFRTAALYWTERGLNHYADRDDLLTITKRINGGENGLEDRQRLYQKARALFVPGEEAAQPSPESTAPVVIDNRTPPDFVNVEKPTPSAPTPAVQPSPLTTSAPERTMPTREQRREERQDNREERQQKRALRRAKIKASISLIGERIPLLSGVYQRTYDREIRFGATEQEAHEDAIEAAWKSFARFALAGMAKARFGSGAPGKVAAFISNRPRLKAFREFIFEVFRDELVQWLDDMDDAREVVGLLTGEVANGAHAVSEAAQSVGNFFDAFSDMMEDEPQSEPEVVKQPRRPAPRKPRDVRPAPVVDVAAEVPTPRAARRPLVSRPAPMPGIVDVPSDDDGIPVFTPPGV